MKLKQGICMTIVGAALILAAGLIETQPLVSFALLVVMAASAYIGRLDQKRVTTADIERSCSNVKNQ